MASRLAPLSPEKIELDQRRCFTPRQRAELFKRAKGRCEICGVKIRFKWIAGHILAHALGGRTIVDNGRVECPECAKKTHAKDTDTAARCERMAGRTGQYKRRKENGSRLKSPSIPENLTKGFDGKVRKQKER